MSRLTSVAFPHGRLTVTTPTLSLLEYVPLVETNDVVMGICEMVSNVRSLTLDCLIAFGRMLALFTEEQ